MGFLQLEMLRLANVYPTGNELREVPDFHTEIEAKMKMNW
jgi:hypothetical protein